MNEPNKKPALQIRDLSFRYSDSDGEILRVPELTVTSGQFVSLLGVSGSGKSTLLRLIAGLLSATDGKVNRASTGEGEIGMVFQSPNLVPWRTARDNVSLPGELGRRTNSKNRPAFDELLQLVGLKTEDAEKHPHELSGGMQMRVSLARSLSLSPSTLLLDEPFGALDDLLRMQLEEELRGIHEERGLTTILVTHSISEATFMSDRVLILAGQPAAVVSDITVDLPPIRDCSVREGPEFQRIQAEITQKFRATADSAAV